MLEIQRVVYHWEGSINKILFDDKVSYISLEVYKAPLTRLQGLLVLCALGLPPLPHADDPVRAIGTAIDLVENIKVSAVLFCCV